MREGGRPGLGGLPPVRRAIEELRQGAERSRRWARRWTDSPTRRSSPRSSAGRAGPSAKLRRRSSRPSSRRSWRASDEIGDDVPDGDFFARGAARDALGRAVDAARRAGRARPPAARGDGARRLHALRGRRCPTSTGSCDSTSGGAALARETDLAAGRREPGRGGLPRSSSRRRSTRGSARPAVKARGRAALAPASTAGGRTHDRSQAAVPRAALRPAALAVAPADHRASRSSAATRPARSASGSTPGRRATGSCSTRGRRTPRGRWAAWSRWAAGSSGT